MSKYTLLLVRPFQEYKQYAIQSELAKLLGKKSSNACLALPLIAALTPDNYDIKIIDEEIEPIPNNIKADIVGITTTTPTASRAYEIADTFRKRNVPVIMGGPYATFNYEKVIQHADSVVLGEAEELWAKCLKDFENGQLKKKYFSDQVPDFKKTPIPRWDLYDTDNIMSLTVQATRGCPYACEFCLTSEMFGHKMRYRNEEDVIAELEALPGNNFMFADDNLTKNKRYAKRLLSKMKGLNKTWTCQASIDVADDSELLQMLREAGCRFILIGFESLNQGSINEINKHQNKAINYGESIQKIHDAGIYVYGSFIVGFDHDTLDEFDQIARFIQEVNIPVFMLSLLGATPGTKLYQRLVDEGRWFGIETKYNVGIFPLMHFQNFSQSELFIKFVDTLDELFSWDKVHERTIRLFKSGKFYSDRLNDGVKFFTKFKTSIDILFRFRFSKDKHRKLLFKDLFRMLRDKKVSAAEAISTLLMLEGVHQNIKKLVNNKEAYLKIIEKNDQGSWKSMIKDKKTNVANPVDK